MIKKKSKYYQVISQEHSGVPKIKCTADNNDIIYSSSTEIRSACITTNDRNKMCHWQWRNQNLKLTEKWTTYYRGKYFCLFVPIRAIAMGNFSHLFVPIKNYCHGKFQPLSPRRKVECGTHTTCRNVAQLVKCQTSTLLRQVWLPSAVRDFSSFVWLSQPPEVGHTNQL